MLFRNRRKNFSPIGAFSTALLAVALVSAQIAGVAHRIEHAPGSDLQHRLALLQYGENFDDHSHDGRAEQHHHGDHTPKHDCAAYDAATLGNGPPLAQASPSLTAPPHLPVTAVFSTVADNSPHLPFHPRAPPRA